MTEIPQGQSTLTTEETIVFYELEKVRFIIKDGCGIDIAYAYEDLVFSEHGLFIIQFDGKTSDTFYCWFNQDCVEADRHSLFKSLTTSATLNGMKVFYKGKFEMKQDEEKEEIRLNFLEV